ncbi:MAG: hypothetical protein IJG80_08840 [Selenomonadaceae bacterium]|nr:hypothetical protein [Selenomonadaceae bacterium]
MTATALKEQISKMYSHILFEYDGKDCGVDPLARNEIVVWFGEKNLTAHSVDEAMQVKLFDSKSLNDIAKEIEVYE